MSDDESDSSAPPQASVSDDERELESLLDDLQPGWRDVLVHRRFLPSMTVSTRSSRRRPGVRRADFRAGLVSGRRLGRKRRHLSDAAMASARAAARAIIAEAECGA